MVTVARVDIDRTSERATYLQLADILRERIKSGELKSGERIPSVHDLVIETQLADATIRKAVRVLRDEGLVRTAPGRGVYVR
jgi:DNA-binding GntR family transcriptional regulator